MNSKSASRTRRLLSSLSAVAVSAVFGVMAIRRLTAVRLFVVAAVFMAGPTILSGRQIWLVQFQTQFPAEPPVCDAFYSWQSRLLLTNTTDLPQTVRLLNVSNGPMRADAQGLTLAPHHTTEILGDSPAGPNWAPDASRAVEPIWVDELEVPDGVVVSNRGEVFINQPAAGSTAPTCQFDASVTERVNESETDLFCI